jgi:molecular chaperone DnaJ
MSSQSIKRKHYATLGLSVDYPASLGEIKAAYKHQARLHHPDKNPGNEGVAKEKFQEVRATLQYISRGNSR